MIDPPPPEPKKKDRARTRGVFNPPPDRRASGPGPVIVTYPRRCPDDLRSQTIPCAPPPTSIQTPRPASGPRRKSAGERVRMNTRNRIGLYGSYFFGMAAIGFTLPYLPLYLGEKGLSDRRSDRVDPGGIVRPGSSRSDSGRTGSAGEALPGRGACRRGNLDVLLRGADGVWLGLLVILFAENGIARAVVESLSGAEAAARLPRAVSCSRSLRFWKPIGIILVALLGSWMSERYGVGAILWPMAIVQGLAVAAALLIHEPAVPRRPRHDAIASGHGHANSRTGYGRPGNGWLPNDAGLWVFVAAMILFHVANAPGGVYLGLFLKRDLHAPERMLAYAFVVSMVAWMLVVWPAGWLADRCGRKPLLIAALDDHGPEAGIGVRDPDARIGRGQPGARRPGQRPVRSPRRGLGEPTASPTRDGRARPR